MKFGNLPRCQQWLAAVLATTLFFTSQVARAQIELTYGDIESEKNAAATAAKQMMSFYHGDEPGQTPGKLPGTWWEGGAMFMNLIEYWHLTGDTTFNKPTTTGMIHQSGENADYQPQNHSRYLGNDDQVFWGLAAMTAAELKYPDAEDGPSWLSLAQAVFNTQYARWDTETCGGGLRWQMNSFQPGYDLKNSVSNGGIFALSARLARYTTNDTYAKFAETVWDWTAQSPLMDTDRWWFADTTEVAQNCSNGEKLQWSYNYGLYLNGAAFMYDYTNHDTKWSKRVDGLLGGIFRTFFPKKYGGNIMSEITCEPVDLCDNNQKLFKGFTLKWMAFATTLVPHTSDIIMPKLQGTAEAVAQTCAGGKDGTSCGLKWYEGKWDGTTGRGQEMSALAAFTALLVRHENKVPLTSETGGISEGDPNAGMDVDTTLPSIFTRDITAGDKAGAGILTALFIFGWGSMMFWMVSF